MMNLIDVYGEDLLMVFNSAQLKDEQYNALAVIRTGVEKKQIEGVLTMNYEEDFESLLCYKVPPKTRKPAKLLSYARTLEVLDKVSYGTIGCVIDGMPYTYAINQVMINGHLYFHTGRKGYKLKALGTKVSYNAVEDLGMAYNGTHNFRSVQISGRLIPTEDYDIKKAVFLKLINHLNPNHAPYVETMQETTLVYELEMDYMMGRENLYLPNDGKPTEKE